MQILERNDLSPVCPHCESQLEEVFSKKVKTTLGVRFVYFCSRCRKVLGLSHRKGFWMG